MRSTGTPRHGGTATTWPDMRCCQRLRGFVRWHFWMAGVSPHLWVS